MPVKIAAFTVVLAAMREDSTVLLRAAFVSTQPVDKTVTASAQTDAGIVPLVLVVPRAESGQL